MTFLEYKNELELINNNLTDILPFYKDNRDKQDRILKEIVKNKVILERLSNLTISEAEKEVHFTYQTLKSKI